MLTANQLKEHVLNRLGYGQAEYHSNRYDELGTAGYIAQQLDGSILPIPSLGTTIGVKLRRDVMSQRQLEAALLDFWFNHFHVDTRSVLAFRIQETIIGRRVGYHQNVAILPHLLGDFGAMLIRTAKSPSMLDYLNNRVNYKDEVVDGVVYGGNDNYARELMELHTLGVDGGYDETDITEAARILTGWSVRNDAYYWNEARHDFGEKSVLGVDYPAGVGEQEGIDFLNFLANHPSTPRFLARKLVARFVNEVPPPAVTDAVAEAYGPNRDLLAMTTTMFNHPDFVDPANFRAKVKPPHRYVASAVMAMGASTYGDFSGILGALVDGIIGAGESPYVFGPPTGYPERSAFWISGTSMVTRFEIAERIAYHPALRGRVRSRAGTTGANAVDTVDAVAAVMVPGGLSESSRVAVLDHVAANAMSNEGRVSAAAHLILCSPEFVRY